MTQEIFLPATAKPQEIIIISATSVFNLSEQLRNDRADDTLKAIIAIEESTHRHPHRPSARSEKRHRSRELLSIRASAILASETFAATAEWCSATGRSRPIAAFRSSTTASQAFCLKALQSGTQRRRSAPQASRKRPA